MVEISWHTPRRRKDNRQKHTETTKDKEYGHRAPENLTTFDDAAGSIEVIAEDKNWPQDFRVRAREELFRPHLRKESSATVQKRTNNPPVYFVVFNNKLSCVPVTQNLMNTHSNLSVWSRLLESFLSDWLYWFPVKAIGTPLWLHTIELSVKLLNSQIQLSTIGHLCKLQRNK